MRLLMIDLLLAQQVAGYDLRAFDLLLTANSDSTATVFSPTSRCDRRTGPPFAKKRERAGHPQDQIPRLYFSASRCRSGIEDK